MVGETATPVALACEGHVIVRQIPLADAQQQPLEIHGGQLLVTQLETKTPHVTLHGVAPGQPAGSALAQVVGHGVTMLVDTIEVDQRENRLWSDGPGKATILMQHDMAGNPSATPVPAELTWQGGLKFDGQIVIFEREVVVNETDNKVHCDLLAAKFAAPIHFGDRIDQTNTAPNEVECRGQVVLENVQRDPGGVTSHAVMQLSRLTVNQQTGGAKRRWPRRHSCHPLRQQHASPCPANRRPHRKRRARNAAGSKLSFVRVDFHQGLDGNIYTRDVTFHDRVRTIYGPVDSWDQEIDPNQPNLPPDAMTLTSDDLRMNEDPLAARAVTPPPGGKRAVGPMQMKATGDVRIAGQVPNQGEFSVQADRASYDQTKDALILEGDERTPAKLWRRDR